MNTAMAETFYEEIRAHPDDDGPRLVYADWLEEQGQAERAEFIRVQCRLAALPRWHPDRILLGWRERVLLARHGRAWRAELPVIEGAEWGAFARGFVHEIRVPDLEILAQRAEEIRQAAPVRRATVTDDNGTDTPWGHLGPLPFLDELRLQSMDTLFENPDAVFQSPLLSTLRVLDLTDTSLAGEQVTALVRSPHLGRLTTLILDHCYLGDGNLGTLAAGPQFRNLTTLSMRGNQGGYHEDARIRPPDVATFAGSPYLTGLRALDLSHNELDTASLARLLASPHLRHLRELNVSDNHGRDGSTVAAGGFNKLARSDAGLRLHSLNLSHNPIRDAGAAALAEAPFCAELAELDLNTCEIGATGVQRLAAAPWFKHLARLNLDHNSAGVEGAHALAGGMAGGRLAALQMRDNDLTTEAVKTLAQAPGLRSLATLDLSENPLEAVALRDLLASPQLAGLRELALERCGIDGRWWTVNGEEDRRGWLARLVPQPRTTDGRPAALDGLHWPDGLVRLALSTNPLGDVGVQALLQCGALARVHELVLQACQVTPVGAAALAAAAPPELHWLDLSRNEGLQDLTALAQSRLAAQLVDLNVNQCGLGDAAAVALANATWPLLSRLSLQKNALTNAGALALQKSEGLAGVQAIHCRENKITWDALNKLGPRFQGW